MHLPARPDDRTAAAPNAPALADDHVFLSSLEVADSVNNAAATFSRNGVSAGDVVAIMLPN